MLLEIEDYRRVQLPHAGQMVDLVIRPISPADAPALQLHHSRLSSQSIFYRFHGIKKELSDQEAQELCGVDGQQEAAVVAIRNSAERPNEIEGVARYYQTDPGIAEMAIVVRDSYQGQGLGKLLLEELIKVARQNDIRYLDALVLFENRQMRHFLQELGYATTTKTLGMTVLVRLDLDNPITPNLN